MSEILSHPIPAENAPSEAPWLRPHDPIRYAFVFLSNQSVNHFS